MERPGSALGARWIAVAAMALTVTGGCRAAPSPWEYSALGVRESCFAVRAEGLERGETHWWQLRLLPEQYRWENEPTVANARVARIIGGQPKYVYWATTGDTVRVSLEFGIMWHFDLRFWPRGQEFEGLLEHGTDELGPEFKFRVQVGRILCS
jgi:hypothetical protein